MIIIKETKTDAIFQTKNVKVGDEIIGQAMGRAGHNYAKWEVVETSPVEGKIWKGYVIATCKAA